MSKQDRQGVRTPADLEQKYQFGKKFAELMGIATDARESVDSLASTLRSEMREQETSIIRDTEKIMLTALENYVKTDEMAEVEQLLRGELLVMSNRITASVTDYTTKITAAEKEITDLRGELSVEADAIRASVQGNSSRIDATNKSVSDLSSSLNVELGSIKASVKSNTDSISATNKNVSQLNSDLAVERGRITASVTDYTNKFAKVGEDIAESESKLRSEITTKADGISMTVDQHTKQIETVDGKVDKQTSDMRSDLNLLSGKMTLDFEGVNNRVAEVNGEMQTITEELAKHFVFDANGLTIKAGENDMQLRLDNGLIKFLKNGQQFGWWDGTNFHTGSIYVELNQQARFGNFAFVPRSNGSLDFLKVGG